MSEIIDQEVAFEQLDKLRRTGGREGAYRPFFDEQTFPMALKGLKELKARGVRLIDQPIDNCLILSDDGFDYQENRFQTTSFGGMIPDDSRPDFSRMTLAYLAAEVQGELPIDICNRDNDPEITKFVTEFCQAGDIEIRQI